MTRTRGQKPDWIRFSGVEAGAGAGDKTQELVWISGGHRERRGRDASHSMAEDRSITGRGAQDTRAVLQEILDRAGVSDLRHVLYNYYPGGMCMLNRLRTFGV